MSIPEHFDALVIGSGFGASVMTEPEDEYSIAPLTIWRRVDQGGVRHPVLGTESPGSTIGCGAAPLSAPRPILLRSSSSASRRCSTVVSTS
jgi:hypothetical protein